MKTIFCIFNLKSEAMQKHLLRQAYLYYGITDRDELFVQISDTKNKVLYQYQVPVKVNPTVEDLKDAVISLFPDSFADSGLVISRISVTIFDGLKLRKDERSFQTYRKVQTFFPDFSDYILDYVIEKQQA